MSQCVEFGRDNRTLLFRTIHLQCDESRLEDATPNDHYGLSRGPFSVTISESVRPSLVSFLSSRIVHLTTLEMDCCDQLIALSIRRNREPQMSHRGRWGLSREEDQVLGFHLCTKLLVRDGSHRHRE
jgi:hypothetical protein